MPAYVIDTDIATYVLEGRKEVVAYLVDLQKSDKNRIYFSEVTRAELLSTPGLMPQRIAEIEALVACADEVIAVDTEVARVAGELRRLNNAGRPAEQCPTCHRRLGGRLRLPDALVAATAITESAVLVTHNVKDYGHLVGRGLLTVENPLDGRARASSYE